MKKIILIFLVIIFTLTPVYSKDESKAECFSFCQKDFRVKLSECRENNTNTAVRTACLDKARIILNECLDSCRDKYPNKLK